MMVDTRYRRRRRASWADLPEDMLGDVLRRLPSFAYRYRLRAVCRAWREAWRRQPHPPVPWLLVPGHCVSLPDGAIHRVAPLSEDARAAPCRGSLGDWLAFVPLASSGGGAPFLLNPFSAARIPLPLWADQDQPIRKIVMSSSPDSDSCVVAAMVDCGENGRRIAACRPGEGHESAVWWPVSLPFELQDIAFYEARLHALPSCGGLVVFEEGELDLLRREPRRLHDRHRPPPPAANIDYDDEDTKTTRYLMECEGRLLMVIRHVWHDIQRTHKIEVHALEPNGSWVPVKEIVGHALFVGEACSGAYPAAAGIAAAGSTSHDLIRENQVCFVDDEMVISAELDKRKTSVLSRSAEASGWRGDLYGSVLRRLRTVNTFGISDRRTNAYRAGHLSARTGRWHPARVARTGRWHAARVIYYM